MSTEGQPRYCLDCGDRIGNGVRCDDCTIDCRAATCGLTFKTKGDRNNHELDGHCAACGNYLGDRPTDAPSRVSHREEHVHTFDHFTIDGAYQHPVTGKKMGGGFLCGSCSMDDLNTV